MKVKVKGLISNFEFDVLCVVENEEVDFYSSEILKERFFSLLDEKRIYAGTFQPDINSEINALNVLKNFLFDELISIEVSDMKEKMPFDKDVMY